MDPSITLQLNKNKKQIADLKTSYNGLQHKYDELMEKYEKLKDENKYLKEKIELKELKSTDLLRNEILNNINKNQNRKPNGHRFTENIYIFSQLLHNISPKYYEILQNILILPSISQLSDFYAPDNNFYIECIQKVENIPILIKNIRKSIISMNQLIVFYQLMQQALIGLTKVLYLTFLFFIYSRLIQNLNASFYTFFQKKMGQQTKYFNKKWYKY